MNATKIKTRHGLILQDLLGTALSQAGFSFRENWQYDPDFERPDFTIPDSDSPTFAVEVHQTDARDSFRMKILRAFNAVAEAKVFFGEKLVSVNILFGDPDNELPESNVKALCGIFDVNLVPRNDPKEGNLVKQLEERALKLAEDETHDVASAANKLRSTCKKEIKGLSSIVKRTLTGVVADERLAEIWKLERKRIAALIPAPTALPTTHYKRCILESLYLSDDDFSELVKVRDPNKGSKSLQGQLVDTGLATTRKAIGGDRVELIPRFRKFICDQDSPTLRASMCDRLKIDNAMRLFFADIRDSKRRTKMVNCFLESLALGEADLRKAAWSCFSSDDFHGIEHTRCWILDLLPLCVGESHNHFNGRIFRHRDYSLTLGNPYPNLVIKSARLGNSERDAIKLVEVATKCFWEYCAENDIDPNDIDAKRLELDLLRFRIEAAIKLHKLNPLFIAVEEISRSLGLGFEYTGLDNFLSDISTGNRAQSRFRAYRIFDVDGQQIILNSLYVGEGYGSDHKADEWSARGRALGYRMAGGEVEQVSYLAFVFVVDGEWSEKSLKKLHSAGWTHICQLPDVEDTLRNIFGLK